MSTKSSILIRPTTDADRKWMKAEMKKWWGSELVVVRGEKYYPAELDGFIAEKDDKKVGLILLHIEETNCEMMSLTTTGEFPGLGEKLIKTVISDLKTKHVNRLSVVTTNDNTNALRFYQKMGFEISDWRKNAIETSRKIKPEIPLLGNYRIPIRDEIELEMTI